MSFVIIYGKGPEFIYKLLQHKYKTKKWEEVKKKIIEGGYKTMIEEYS